MYKDILIAVDHDHEQSWKHALPVAIAHCQAFGARLHVVTVVQDLGVGNVSSFLPMDFEKKMMAKVKQWLDTLVQEHVPAELEVQRVVATGKVYAEVLRVAGEVNADLIVMASHNPELGDYLIGSNAAKVARHADRSVLILRQPKGRE